MKKAEWLRKAVKRKLKERDKGVVDFIWIMRHFFGHLRDWIEEMEDPRHSSYTIYTQSDLVFMGLMKNICSVGSMRQMEDRFNEETCMDTLRLLSGHAGLEEMPHYDTLNTYLSKLSPDCLSELRKRMIVSLLRGKQFYRGRLLGKYWRVILDGTGLYYFKERHCPNCLSETRKKEDGRIEKRYYHKVLEAKLVLGEKLVLSLGTEFIENEREDVPKQDCELNAARRLLSRIKKEYPRLKICLQGDALYTVEPMMKLCRKNGWGYILTQKESRQKTVGEMYDWICKGGGQKGRDRICREKGKGAYVNGVEEPAGKRERMNLYEYEYETEKKGKRQKIKFQWITNIEVTVRNLEELIEAGRGRWKIENEGFNNQKNGQYRISHINSRNSRAMKNHYLLTQIADIVMQLYLCWSPMIREVGQSIKNTSSRLLESFRRHTITKEDVLYIERYTAVYLS